MDKKCAAMDKRILLLHPVDNVYVVCQSLEGNERLMTPDGEVLVSVPFKVGHKIARRDTSCGETILQVWRPYRLGSL